MAPGLGGDRVRLGDIRAPLDARVANGRLLGRESQQLSIFLSPLDVHVNRSPIQGAVVQSEYQSGKFFAAYRGKASSEN